MGKMASPSTTRDPEPVIILVNPFPYYARGVNINRGTCNPPLGLAYLAAYLEQNGTDCRILDANLEGWGTEEVVRRIGAAPAAWVGITTNIVTARAAVELSRGIKARWPERKVILGGPYATALPEKALRDSGADVVVIGEGEETLGDLLRRTDDPRTVRGICLPDPAGGPVFRTPPRDPIRDLESLPFPAYHLLPDLRRYRARTRARPFALLITSRGCPFGCSYCNKNIFGSVFRKRSAANIVAEVEWLTRRYHVRQIDIVDDVFNLDIARAEEFFDLIIAKGIRVWFSFANGLRADRLTPGLVRKMKRAGVFKVSIGVESGSPLILKQIHKALDLDKAVEAIRLFRREGIVVSGFFMIGLPHDTPQTMQQTIDFARAANPHFAHYALTTPMPGTALYETIRHGGEFLESVETAGERGFQGGDAFSYRLEGMDPPTILKYYRKAYFDFYFRLSKILDILTTLRSFAELRWTLEASLAVLRNIFVKRRKGGTPS